MIFFEETYKVNRDAFNNILRLSPEEIAKPHKVIKTFFDRYNLSDVRQLFYSLHRVAITTENDEFFEPVDRSNMQFELESIEQLVEAVSLLQSNKKLKKKKKRANK